jgi:hypothetical protein
MAAKLRQARAVGRRPRWEIASGILKTKSKNNAPINYRKDRQGN